MCKRFIYFALSVVLFSLFSWNDVYAADKGKSTFTVVIDPGHGGKDSGAKGRKSYEKDIVLAVALEVGKQLKMLDPNITIYYTRDSDRFIGLIDRARFANKKKADLFVSIHANSHKNTTPHGAETYVLGLHRTQDNLEVAMKENSAILYEKDHSTSYSGFDPNLSESYIIFNFIQNKHIEQSISLAELIQTGLVQCGLWNRGVRQAGFLVLREVAMPSVLVELGFISNKENEEYMLSSKGRISLAQNIAKGVVAYKNKRVRAERAEESPSNHESAVNEPDSTRERVIYYRVQVLADKRQLPSKHFGAYADEMRAYREGAFYKYTLFNTTSLTEAKVHQKKLRAKYKDCFIVGFDDKEKKVGSYY